MPVDPFYAAAALSPGAFVLCSVIHWGLIWLCTTDFGAQAVGVAAGHVIAANVLCESFHALNTWVIGPRRVLASGLGWYRAFSYAVMLPSLLVYGAGSSLDLSPAWIVALDAPLLFARATPGSRYLAGLLLVAPVALRFVLVPDASAPSLALAAGIGIASLIIYTRRSRLVLDLARLQSQRTAEAELTAEAARREGAIDVAMSLHDGLSGALFVVRQRVAVAKSPEEVLEAARSFALHARSVLYGIQGRSTPLRDTEDVRRALIEFAELLRVETAVDTGPRVAVDGEELRDLRDIALELVSNAVRHGHARRVTLRLTVDPNVTRLACATEPGAEPERISGEVLGRERSGGRGLRYLSLRVRARGGALVTADTDGQHRHVVSEWPCPSAGRPSLVARLWPELPVGLLASGFLAAANASVESLVCVAVNVPFLGWVTYAMERSVSRARSRLVADNQLRRAAETTPTLSLLDSALTAPLAALETRVLAGEATGCRVLLEQLALTLGDLLWALEWEGDDDELRRELRARYGIRDGMFASLTPRTSLDVTARYELRRIAREAATAGAA